MVQTSLRHLLGEDNAHADLVLLRSRLDAHYVSAQRQPLGIAIPRARKCASRRKLFRAAGITTSVRSSPRVMTMPSAAAQVFSNSARASRRMPSMVLSEESGS